MSDIAQIYFCNFNTVVALYMTYQNCNLHAAIDSLYCYHSNYLKEVICFALFVYRHALLMCMIYSNICNFQEAFLTALTA